MQEIDKEKFGNRFYQIRTQNNYSEQKLAWALGIDMESYRKYEIGLTEIPCSILYKFCNFFEISADEIIFPEKCNNKGKTYKLSVTVLEE